MIRVGVIGVGYWGPNLVRTINEIDDSLLVRVADLRPGRLKFISQRYPEVQTTTAVDDVLSDPSIDAVFIATPPDTHRAIAVRALEAGKHVFVEKPLAMCLADAAAIVEAAEKCDRKLGVGHLFLHHPAVICMRQMLEAGELGDLHFISSARANLGPPNSRVDVLWDLAPHDLSVILQLMDEVPDEVSAHGGFFSNSAVADVACVTLCFPSGRLAQITVSWLTSNKTRLMRMVCSGKTVVYDDMQSVQKIQVYDAGSDNRVNASPSDTAKLAYGPGSIWIPPLDTSEPLRAECGDFLNSIRTGKEPVSNGRRALQVVRVLELASQSIIRHRARAN